MKEDKLDNAIKLSMISFINTFNENYHNINTQELEKQLKQKDELLREACKHLYLTNSSLLDCINEIHEAGIKISTETDEVRFNNSNEFLDKPEIIELLNE